jgi:hypothetical protein
VSITTTDVGFNSAHGDVFVSDSRLVGGFLQFPQPNKSDRHDITDILFKVALNTITIPPNHIAE